MKLIKLKRILVPIDFTKTTEEAAHIAHYLNYFSDGKMILFHMVKDEREISFVTEAMKEFIEKNFPDNMDDIEFKVIEGNIYSDINELVEAVDADLVVLGRHENTLLERFFGTDALKVASTTHVPFIISQAETPIHQKGLDKILFPFNHERQSLQVTQMAASLAKQFNAKIYLAGYPDPDRSLYREMRLNESLIQDFLDKHDIEYDHVPLINEGAYKKVIIEHAINEGVDLIAVSYLDFGIRSFFTSFIDRLLIDQDKIPVLTVNGPEVMRYKPKLNFVPA